MRPIPLALAVTLAGALASCADRSAPPTGGQAPVETPEPPAALQVTTLAALPIEKGAHALPQIHQGKLYWLATDPERGIVVTDADGQVWASLPGSFEQLAVQPEVTLGSEMVTLIAAADIDTGDIVLASLNWSARALTALTRLEADEAEVDALCWYPTAQGHLSLFLADARGQVEQRYIVDGNRHELINRSVRQFSGAPDMSACVVDAARSRLYLVEEAVGIWAYPAEAETSLERELVIAAAPAGPIESEIEGLALAPDGSLLISAPEMGAIWHVQPDARGTERQLSTAPVQTPEAIGVAQADGKLLIAIYDDESTKYWQAEYSATGASTPPEDPAPVYQFLAPVAETEPVRRYGDAADDPAIWVNAANPAQSLILGTDKKQGLMVYDLSGAKRQALNVGRVNNVDLRYGFEFGADKIDLAAASNRTLKAISLFAIDPATGKVRRLNDIATDLDDPYGLCMGAIGGQIYVFINDSDGRFQQYQLVAEQDLIVGRLVRKFQVDSQPEGCVVDDAGGMLYFGEEAKGIWQVGAAPEAGPAQLVASVGPELVADVEGMAIYPLNGKNYLIVSSQGDNSYAVFALDGGVRHLDNFRIGTSDDLTIDGASETDGLDVTAAALGPQFPHGVLVVQDGYNVLPQAPQNFKLVSGTELRDFIEARVNPAP